MLKVKLLFPCLQYSFMAIEEDCLLSFFIKILMSPLRSQQSVLQAITRCAVHTYSLTLRDWGHVKLADTRHTHSIPSIDSRRFEKTFSGFFVHWHWSPRVPSPGCHLSPVSRPWLSLSGYYWFPTISANSPLIKYSFVEQFSFTEYSNNLIMIET